MSQSDTVDRILDAAEQLFAERGFSETSLRQITSKAKVNLAAVNYHFGSKNALIQAVFARFINPFTRILRDRLQGVVAESRKVELEELLQIVTSSVIDIPARNSKSLSIFMRLLGLAYTQSQGHLRKYLEQQYSTEFRLFMRLLKDATPELNAVERFWRIQFMLGATAFTMSSSEALGSILEKELGVKTPVVGIVNQLVPFLAAGINAPSDESRHTSTEAASAG
ncbi:TetR/AcrR family transcriptional regulator [Hahella sp. NBU794]|uniref:TetR/AcrR family transcriptional regulator n=1 Tax=Hahella sp. NBU794 TaxID=3422590 RepID=UPI003D6E9B9D